jgi:hypothetical protein
MGALAAVSGFFCLGVFGWIIGGVLILSGVIVGIVNGGKVRHVLKCPTCGSQDIIPLGTPRADALLAQAK